MRSDYFRIVIGILALVFTAIYEYKVDKVKRQCRLWLYSAIACCNADQYWEESEKKAVVNHLAYAWRKWNVHPLKALGHWMHESRMKWYATGYNSNSVDCGVAQINSYTDPGLRQSAITYCLQKNNRLLYKKLRSRNSYDIETSTFMSLYYMKSLNKYSTKMSIVSYNAGSPRPLVGKFMDYYLAVRTQIEKLDDWNKITQDSIDNL